MRKFFACSVGEPDKGYDEENLKRIIDNKAFILHQDTIQKGVYEEIEAGDILILKYRKNFVAFGETTGKVTTSDTEWNLSAPVIEWIFKDPKNPSVGVSTYGIQWSTLDGAGQMGTVKEIDESFAINKIQEINTSSNLFKNILLEITNRKNMKNIESILNLLGQKKQIILQGPPGTGKTRFAKEIANVLTRKNIISSEDIKSLIQIGTKINSITDYATYTVVGLSETNITLKLESGTTQTPNYNKIIQAYSEKKWEGGTKGGDAYEAAIAKYIYKNGASDSEIKLIQFHPAYSYEDFVRGIVVKTNGKSISYETENKVLGEFAHNAYQNWKASNDPQNVFNETWLQSALEDFKENITVRLEDEEKIMLTRKVYINRITEYGIRYNSDVWDVDGGVPDSDIQKMFLADVTSRKQIKELNSLTKTAKSLSTYWLKILELFKKFIQENKLSPVDNTIVVSEKKYILIIDEINRANLPAVLGELIYALEYRGQTVISMYDLEGDRTLLLPPNLYIIGTMNTADRSVGHIDYAIRRRFAFVDILPEIEPVHPTVQDIFKEVSKLFINDFNEFLKSKEIIPARETLSSDFRPEDVWIGHSYFICKKENSDENLSDAEAKPILNNKLKYEVLPILKEYIKDGILQDNDKTKAVLQKLKQWS